MFKVSKLVLVFLLLTLSRQMPTGKSRQKSMYPDCLFVENTVLVSETIAPATSSIKTISTSQTPFDHSAIQKNPLFVETPSFSSHLAVI